LSAPQRIYTSSAESLSLLRAVPRRNTRGLCSQGTENLSQTSNREASRATTLALVCASIAIVINKLSHLSDRIVCAILVGGKYEIYFSYLIW
jgi:hypothetical protein